MFGWIRFVNMPAIHPYTFVWFWACKMRTTFYTFNWKNASKLLKSSIKHYCVHSSVYFPLWTLCQTFHSFAFLSCHLPLNVLRRLCHKMTGPLMESFSEKWKKILWKDSNWNNPTSWSRSLLENTDNIATTFSGLVESVSWGFLHV